MKRNQQFKTALITLLAIFVINNSSFGKWKTLTSTPTQGRWGAMTFVVDGLIYMSGGYVGNFQNKNDLLSFDPATDKWKFKNGLPGNLVRTEGVTFVINGKAYLGLGAQDYNNFSPPPTYLTDLWEYDAATDTWAAKAVFPSNGVSDAAVFVVNNKAYVVGGSEGTTKSDKTWEYDPVTDKWTAKADYPGGGVRNASGFALNGKGYVVGGEVAGTPTNKLYEYDATADTWTEKKSYPETSIWGGVAMVIGNRAYVGTGADGAVGASTVYSDHFFGYDPDADDWVYWQGAELGVARMHGTAVVVNNKAYVGNGWVLDGSNQVFYNDWYEVDPRDILGISGKKSQKIFRIYPNPAKNIIYINANTENVSYALYAVTGSLVQSGTVRNNAINTVNLPAGNYVLKLTTDMQTENHMIILE